MGIKLNDDVILTFHAHYRMFDDKFKTEANPNGMSTKGGCTVACIEFRDGLHWAISRCRDTDVFSKRDGRIKAYGRARGSCAAITPLLSMDEIKVVSEEFARVAINTSMFGIEGYPVLMNEDIILRYGIHNQQFNKIEQQQSLL